MSTPAEDAPTRPRDADDRTIDVVLPARTELAATLRVVCASLGADLGFSVDDIDDLRLAVNEVFTTAADGRGSRLSVTFVPAGRAIGVRVSSTDGEPIELDDLAQTILGSVVDDLRIEATAVEFTKSCAETNG